METGSSSLSESVLAGGVAISPEDLVLPREYPLRSSLDLGHIGSEDRLRGLGGVTNPCPLALGRSVYERAAVPLLDDGEAGFDMGEDAVLDHYQSSWCVSSSRSERRRGSLPQR